MKSAFTGGVGEGGAVRHALATNKKGISKPQTSKMQKLKRNKIKPYYIYIKKKKSCTNIKAESAS